MIFHKIDETFLRIGFEFARVGEMEDKWGVYVYEGHEVTKNREKLRCL